MSRTYHFVALSPRCLARLSATKFSPLPSRASAPAPLAVSKIGVYQRIIFATLLTALMAVAGCGQKGALYLPPSKSDASTTQQDDSSEPSAAQQLSPKPLPPTR